MHTANVYRINAPQVISENIDGEVVIANFETGVYYSMMRMGADLWPYFESGINDHDLLKTVTACYAGDPAEIEAELREFVEKLLTKHLIVELPGAQSHCPPATPFANGRDLPVFEKPVLESYHDMKDLMLLDPIHDVDEAGWPAPKPIRPTRW
jgi:hypothetical protein